MLAMTNFGQNGRLGNQMFQYAFMRSQAERLGVKMYLPAWDGDWAFDLQDAHIRCGAPEIKLNLYREPYESCGFNSIDLQDNVDVTGFFQSERMFDIDLIRRVYCFRSGIALEANAFLGSEFDPSIDVAVGIRLKEFETLPSHYVPQLAYYRKALCRLNARRIFLFSDDVKRAEKLLRRTGFLGKIIASDASPVIVLAAMSRFSQLIIGPSTFHWWGAWLSTCPGKRVIAPLEGATRPGAPMRANDFWPSEWEKLQALRKVDSYKIRIIKQPIIRSWRKLRSLSSRFRK